MTGSYPQLSGLQRRKSKEIVIAFGKTKISASMRYFVPRAMIPVVLLLLMLPAGQRAAGHVLKRSAEDELLDWARQFLGDAVSRVPGVSATSSAASLSAADPTDDECEAVMTQCALRDSLATKYYVRWRDAYVKGELDKQRQLYDDSLARLKTLVNTLVDSIIAVQALPPPADLCPSAETEIKPRTATFQTITPPASVAHDWLPEATPLATVTIDTSPSVATTTAQVYTTSEATTTETSTPPGITPPPTLCASLPTSPVTSTAPNTTSGTTEAVTTSTTTTTPEPLTTPSTPVPPETTTTVTPAATVWDECVTPWSEWSGVYGFGTQERTRRVLRDDVACPESGNLLQTRQVDNVRDGRGRYIFDDLTLVSGNFYHDFIQPSRGLPRDLLVIVDSSASIPDDDFDAIKAGLKVLIDVLCGSFGSGKDNNRMSIIQFSSESMQIHHFRQDQSRDALLAAVDSMQHMRSSTCTGTALEMGYTAFDPTNGARPASQVAHDTLLITDGRSNCGPDIREASILLQSRSTVFALAIDLGYDPKAAKELQAVVSTESPRYLFSLANFQDFNEMVGMVRASRTDSACLQLETTNTGQP